MFEFAASMLIILIAAVFFVVVKAGQPLPDGATIKEMKFGPVEAGRVCPHCRAAGKVHVKSVARQGEFSNTKAVAAVLTAGVSLLAVGIFRDEKVTQAHCADCTKTWVL